MATESYPHEYAKSLFSISSGEIASAWARDKPTLRLEACGN